jgi:alkanesulfonate monooxygenase SsuD/methylene tetrahydromethanopterin reductase-like flavin-dependent oxidoreductase (luciferase family)
LKIDTALLVSDLGEMPAMVRAAEAIGFDGIWTAETAHEPFLPLVLAAEHSQKVSLGTSIAVAFPRSPAVLAYIGWDLARFSKGRFIMGLGTQVKGHFPGCDAPTPRWSGDVARCPTGPGVSLAC